MLEAKGRVKLMTDQIGFLLRSLDVRRLLMIPRIWRPDPVQSVLELRNLLQDNMGDRLWSGSRLLQPVACFCLFLLTLDTLMMFRRCGLALLEVVLELWNTLLN